MPKRIMWKKGMRLTDDILIQSDKCTSDLVTMAFAMSSIGRMGIIPNQRSFDLSVDINKDIVDVISIDCTGITRNGTLIDVNYDTNYSNTFDTRVMIPFQNTEIKYFLCLSVTDNWRDTNDGLCEPQYEFIIIDENSKVPDNSLPVARLVFDEFSWRIDDCNFVPPCLFISSHPKYYELAEQFLNLLKGINSFLPNNLKTEKNDAIKIFWPVVQQLMITMDKEMSTMTPMSLLANIQKFISSFVCGCIADENITIGDSPTLLSYIVKPYNIKDAYAIIREGLEMCMDISNRLSSFGNVEQTPRTTIEAPFIDKSQLRQTVKYGMVRINVQNNAPGATIYYTTDGSMPSQSSSSGNVVAIDSGFTDDWHKEPTKVVTIKLMACKDGLCSNVETFEVQIKKGNPFAGKQI